MTILEAIILGLLQGLTEFLPVSSSGHLVVGNKLVSTLNPDDTLSFVIMVHLGTLLAVFVAFRNQILSLLKDKRPWIPLLVIATIPAGVIGVGIKKGLPQVEHWMESSLWLTSFGFAVTAVLLWFSKNVGQNAQVIDAKRAWWIGCAQAIAITPGISRSGSTITGSLLAGLSREDAFTFSFLMSIPAIGGAALIQAKDLIESTESIGGDIMAAGFVSSMLAGLAAIWILKKLLLAKKLHGFAYYLILASFGTALLAMLGK